ncbi:unnamed protein product [Arctia plantaginis]|uniref:Uncharacterized protein n=1 Tax=Arctia plantaginis TaxID=874455 RepID=A0A8S0ZZ45_ARCPL|nr:unnamed protein product [Arctia plantaginis]CAB3240433.1 unnamed protein product [Arctia plantaginis]
MRSLIFLFSEPSDPHEQLNMVNHHRKMKMMFRIIRQASLSAALKMIIRDEIRRKQQARNTPKLLQLASIIDPTGIAKDLPHEKMIACAEKLRKRYLKAKKTMCSYCKGQAVTTVDTSFKVDGHEEEVQLQAVIVDLNKLEEAGISRLEDILTVN